MYQKYKSFIENLRIITPISKSWLSMQKWALPKPADLVLLFPAAGYVENKIEKKALLAVGRVMKTSALELQKPNNEAYEQMLQKAKDSIRKMPKSQIWS